MTHQRPISASLRFHSFNPVIHSRPCFNCICIDMQKMHMHGTGTGCMQSLLCWPLDPTRPLYIHVVLSTADIAERIRPRRVGCSFTVPCIGRENDCVTNRSEKALYIMFRYSRIDNKFRETTNGCQSG
jgi:hypothetical protein